MATAELDARPAAKPSWLERSWAAVRAEPLLIGLVVLAAVLRFATLDQQSLWDDEAFTAAIVRGSFGDLVSAIPKTESTPPLYYVVTWPWVKVFGTGEAGLRSLSAVFGTLVVPVAYAAARELVSRRVGLIAAALTATSPLLIQYSQEARAYSLVAFLGAVSIYLFARAFNQPSGRTVIALGVVSALAVATHYFAVFLFAVEAAILFTRAGLRRAVLGATAMVGAVGLALIPLADSQNPSGRTGWIAATPIGNRMKELGGEFVFGPSWVKVSHVAQVELAVLLVLAGLTVAGHVWFFARHERRGALLALGLLSGTLGVAFAVRFVGVDYFHFRPLIQAWLPAAILLATIVGAGRWGRAGIAAAAVAVAFSFVAALQVPLNPSLQKTDWRGVVGLIGQRDATRVLVIAPWWSTSASEYYRPTLSLPAAGAPVREIVVISAFEFGAVPDGFRLVERRKVQSLEFRRYRAARPIELRPSDVIIRRPYRAWARLDRRPAELPVPRYPF